MTTGEEPDTQRPSGTADQQQTREGIRAAGKPGREGTGGQDTGELTAVREKKTFESRPVH